MCIFMFVMYVLVCHFSLPLGVGCYGGAPWTFLLFLLEKLWVATESYSYLRSGMSDVI